MFFISDIESAKYLRVIPNKNRTAFCRFLKDDFHQHILKEHNIPIKNFDTGLIIELFCTKIYLRN